VGAAHRCGLAAVLLGPFADGLVVRGCLGHDAFPWFDSVRRDNA
jgi:hypothetical protein